MTPTDINECNADKMSLPTTAYAEAKAPGFEPMAVSIAEASRISGISRSELYRRLSDNRLCAVKSGARTLILLDSLRKHLASLPPATFGGRAAQSE